MHSGVFYALVAAVLFGASTPFAKTLVGQIAPVTLAGLLYLGSGLGLLTWFVFRKIATRNNQQTNVAPLTKPDLPWLAGAIVAGGIAGPLLLMVGLTLTPASSASLLLNMEGVLTALLAWFIFKENFDQRIFAGMVLIVVAGVLLSWSERPALGVPWGAIAITAACLCWAIDNNLTRKVSASDAVQTAGIKGLVAGSVNLGLAFALGYELPETRTAVTAGAVGFCGYGLSLVMFVLALRHLGTARTGAYFSAAPFVGAALSLFMLGESPELVFWIAAALMGAGIWLHLTESHEHEHTHEPMDHTHAHRHDAHHQHKHDFDWDGSEPHVHPHPHGVLRHSHKHYPDIHHRHGH
ncbi:EamA family transporter [Herbaspirillum sp. GCM10030257]|uniref:DMT family transporter n=1 Tax=Herbaspirillum sp. GCM10030257 TaxID=3273393 RepID=UPI00360F5153